MYAEQMKTQTLCSFIASWSIKECRHCISLILEVNMQIAATTWVSVFTASVVPSSLQACNMQNTLTCEKSSILIENADKPMLSYDNRIFSFTTLPIIMDHIISLCPCLTGVKRHAWNCKTINLVLRVKNSVWVGQEDNGVFYLVMCNLSYSW